MFKQKNVSTPYPKGIRHDKYGLLNKLNSQTCSFLEVSYRHLKTGKSVE